MSKEADEVITTKRRRNMWLLYDQFGYRAEKNKQTEFEQK